MREPTVGKNRPVDCVTFSPPFRSSLTNHGSITVQPYASEACCEGSGFGQSSDTSAERYTNYLYDQERVTFETAEARCASMTNRMSCDFENIQGLDKDYKKGYHWTTDNCVIQVKVNDVGQVALVFKPDSYDELHPHIKVDNRNFFKVYWDGSGDFPNANPSYGNSCGNNTCESLPSGECLCDTVISESRVFKAMPTSVDEVLSSLTIGAYDPAAYSNETYAQTLTENGVTAYFVTAGVFDTNTVFEVTDGYGRVFRFKNTYERVRIVGASEEYAFRNAPSFMSVLNTEVSRSWSLSYFSLFVLCLTPAMPFCSRPMHAMLTTRRKQRWIITSTTTTLRRSSRSA